MTNLTIDELTNVELTPKGKFAVWSSVLAVLFFSQIAYNIGDFPVSTDFACYALIALYLMVSGYASVSPSVMMLYIIAAAFACLTMVLTTAPASWTSLLLLFVLYAPFSFRLQGRQDLELIQQYIQSTYVSAATVIAIVAIVQFILVNGLGATALTNVYFALPEAIRGAGSYTFFRESGGGIVKANGFFLRESSTLSIVAALALVIEYFASARKHILAILAVALFFSFSGSGFLALALAFLMPRSINRLPIFLVSSAIFILVFFLAYKSEIPGLTLWFNRLSEFETPGSSGYARFVAPMEMVQRNLNDGGATMWLGNGAGSFLRSIGLLRVKYEVNDPTWAKLIYEYGLVGLGLISTIFAVRLYSSDLRPQICNYILLVWISGGLVLKPEFVLIVWLLTLVPQTYSRSVIKKRYR